VFAEQQTILLQSCNVSGAANDFAAELQRFRYSKRFCCAAATFPVRQTILLCSCDVSRAASDFAVQAATFAVQQTILLHCCNSCRAGIEFAVQLWRLQRSK